MKLRDKLKKLIETAGVSSYEISIKTGISESTLSRVLNGRTSRLNIKNIELLAKYFNIDASTLRDNFPLKDNFPLEIKAKNQIDSDCVDTGNDLSAQRNSQMIDNLFNRLQNQSEEIGRLKVENERLREEIVRLKNIPAGSAEHYTSTRPQKILEPTSVCVPNP